MDGPLQGYVCQAKHGSDWRVLAPNLNSFIRFLKRLPDNKRFFVEEGSFVYPRTLSEGELYVAKGLVDLSYESKATCMERSTFAELALSMISDAELLQVLRLESHPDSNSSSLIRRRLEAISTAPAKKALAKICGK